MRGVSANVMCGQFGNYGTGSFGLVLDMKEMEKMEAFDVKASNRNDDIEKAFGVSTEHMDCNKSKIAIRNNVVNIHVTGETVACNDDYDAGF
jgi:DNA-directed RNA polymerase II subunit RPB1